MYKVVKKATELIQDILKDVINEDDIVVDATLGNGKDTIFLSQLVPYGKVYAFDIQERAIKKFIEDTDMNIIKNVVLINSGHEHIEEFVREKPKAIIFNLGYLPGGDKDITTKADTTIVAVKKGLEMLLPGGLMILIVYVGHENGKEEAVQLRELVKELNRKVFSAMEINYSSKDNNAPFIIIIEKNDNYRGHI
ncbi:hypothetical protein Q428_08370 [Fervidicella metallireducens AeB]|uniref:rRNA methyltransferase n=2 Tax=Fervidicella TaxID=1403538 RepID=A0A017RUF2_9CLOT|nr:class I SAM-dependent methyltransferase [Fervidicella metallireducens]EYE88403.1 hypothetical protein Q428_08370 [Fervidicella metallireducens AeB]